MKYFLTSLGQLASTMDEVEKTKVEKLTLQFLNQHEYFSQTWKLLSESEKKQVLDIIASGKGVIPYEKIKSIHCLNLRPENGVFFSMDEFYSSLKGKAINDEEYNNSKKLYTLLRMRNLSDLNDLYNAQDVILLLKLMENRFQAMYEKSLCNPRKCNSASKLSSCIQRKQSKVILALPTNNSVMMVFENTLIGGFSCVNTRLSFDTELLMTNLSDADYKKMKKDESSKAYKTHHHKNSKDG